VYRIYQKDREEEKKNFFLFCFLIINDREVSFCLFLFFFSSSAYARLFLEDINIDLFIGANATISKFTASGSKRKTSNIEY
jgi:hypothetical protein